VTLIRLPAEESLVSVVRLDAEVENGEGDEGAVEPAADTPDSAE
jgi:DNA gyrase subunit A